MSDALLIAGLWLAFGGTHVGLSSLRVRPRLVRALSERGYLALFSLIALAIFVPMVWFYFAHKHTGSLFWVLPRTETLRWAIYLGQGVAFTLIVASFLAPSPASFGMGDPKPRGVYRITRHPLNLGLALFGLLHLPFNGAASDVAFFGGFVAFGVVGSWHQDQRKLAESSEDFRRFHAGTPFLPFTGRETLRGLRELSPLVIALGVGVTIALRYLHPVLFAR